MKIKPLLAATTGTVILLIAFSIVGFIVGYFIGFHEEFPKEDLPKFALFIGLFFMGVVGGISYVCDFFKDIYKLWSQL